MSRHIRLLSASDAGEILRVERKCFRAPWTYEQFEQDLKNNPCARYIGLFEENTLIGYGAVWLLMEEAHVMSFCIDPAYQRQGLGEMLMKRLIALSADCGARFMELEVRRSNEAARSLYHKLGFLRVGCKKAYYEDNGEDAIVMALIAMPAGNAENDAFLITEASSEIPGGEEMTEGKP